MRYIKLSSHPKFRIKLQLHKHYKGKVSESQLVYLWSRVHSPGYWVSLKAQRKIKSSFHRQFDAKHYVFRGERGMASSCSKLGETSSKATILTKLVVLANFASTFASKLSSLLFDFCKSMKPLQITRHTLQYTLNMLLNPVPHLIKKRSIYKMLTAHSICGHSSKFNIIETEAVREKKVLLYA